MHSFYISDDTSVAIVEKHDAPPSASGQGFPTPSTPTATLHFLENVTADTRAYKGIHPIVAHESHQQNLANLVDKALRFLPPVKETGEQRDAGSTVGLSPRSGTYGDHTRRKPDFISVTRGPGMRSSILTGLDTAKGLSVAWQVPLVGVHHMQAHLLTPRLVSALEAHKSQPKEDAGATVEFPFLSILVSGGHTILVHSASVVEHSILGETVDIAIGDCIDKLARLILPPSYLAESKTTMYGKALEAFAFPNGPSDYSDYVPPATRQDEMIKVENTQWGWSFGIPFVGTRLVRFTFSGFLSSVERQLQKIEASHIERGSGEVEDFLPHEARVALARDVMRVCFEHLASRTVIALESMWEKRQTAHNQEGKSLENIRKEKKRAWSLRQTRMEQTTDDNNPQLDDGDIKTLVVSGGVAANRFLISLLRTFLDVRGFQHVKIVAPPPKLCTDNAAMIGWAGMEMYDLGWQTDLGVKALRKWTLDKSVDDGGILGPDGWVSRGGES